MATPKKQADALSMVTPKRELLRDGLPLPSPLLANPITPRYIPDGSSLNNLDRKFPALEAEEEMSGKAGLVYLATSNPGQHSVAIKRQTLEHPNDKQSTGYRELAIMQALNSQIEGNHNFIKLLDWNKCWVVQTPPRKPSTCSPSEKENVQCLNFVMKQAGEPLHALTGKGQSMSLYVFKQVLFQVLFSLAKAQEACEFMHNDLHLRNILLEQRPSRTGAPRFHRYSHRSEMWLVDSSLVVTILDFGLSRATLADGTVVNNQAHSFFMPARDVEHLSAQFRKFKISSWVDSASEVCADVTVDTEKERKRLKRSIMQRMTKGDTPTTLIRHPFFQSLRHSQASSRVLMPAPTNLPSKPVLNPKSPHLLAGLRQQLSRTPSASPVQVTPSRLRVPTEQNSNLPVFHLPERSRKRALADATTPLRSKKPRF